MRQIARRKSVGEPKMTLESEIQAKALAVGFDAVGIASAKPDLEQEAALRQFLKLGRHGDMDWLVEKADRRRQPNALWPSARSIIMLGLNYGPDDNPMSRLAQAGKGNISVYAGRKGRH